MQSYVDANQNDDWSYEDKNARYGRVNSVASDCIWCFDESKY